MDSLSFTPGTTSVVRGRRIGHLAGFARPTPVLLRQIRNLHGEAGCSDMRQVMSDCYDVQFLGAALDRAGLLAWRDSGAIACELTPLSGFLTRGMIDAAIARALIHTGGKLNPFEVAEHLLVQIRASSIDGALGLLETWRCSLGDTAEADILKLAFNNTTWANVGDATGLVGSSSAGSLYVETETANPNETGTQTTSESAYTSYARVAVARTSGGWTISGTSPTQAANTAAVTFPAATGGSETETNFAIGRASSSTGEVLWYGALTASLAVSNGITPSFAIAACVATLD